MEVVTVDVLSTMASKTAPYKPVARVGKWRRTFGTEKRLRLDGRRFDLDLIADEEGAAAAVYEQIRGIGVATGAATLRTARPGRVKATAVAIARKMLQKIINDGEDARALLAKLDDVPT